MKPSQVSTKLRQIAAAIDNSENPCRDLVAADLRRIVASVDPEYLGELIMENLAKLTRHGPLDMELNGETWDIAFSSSGHLLATKTDPETGDQEEEEYIIKLESVYQ